MAHDGKAEGRVTIRMVAEHAGVSVAAVSKVLRNAYGVSDALRQNVQAAIDRLGYRPSVAARGMRGRTYTIGILVADLENPFMPQIIAGAETILEPSGIKVLLGVGEGQERIETTLIESMMDYHMDGVILVAPRLTSEVIDRYGAFIPLVAIAHHEPQAAHFDTVNSDDRRGAMIAVESLLALGHGDVGMLSLLLDDDAMTNVSPQRERGYLDAMRAAGLHNRARITRLPDRLGIGDPQLDAWLTSPDRPRAVFVWSDLHAVPLLNRAAILGIRVPDDLAVVAYDNSSVAALPLIDLASIDQSGHRIGVMSARSLLSRIDGRRAPSHILIEPELRVRGSLTKAATAIRR